MTFKISLIKYVKMVLLCFASYCLVGFFFGEVRYFEAMIFSFLFPFFAVIPKKTKDKDKDA